MPGGRVRVAWRWEADQKSGEDLLLQWTEQGGPAVKPPQLEDYGTVLIRELLTFEFDGAVDRRYATEGLTCQILLPRDRVLENLTDRSRWSTPRARRVAIVAPRLPSSTRVRARGYWMRSRRRMAAAGGTAPAVHLGG